MGTKMQWFVDSFNNGTLTYEIKDGCNKIGSNFGSVIIPTGGGKSGLVYADIVDTIASLGADERVIFNISCPILRLLEQFTKDLYDCISAIYGTNDIKIFSNSSNTKDNFKIGDTILTFNKKFKESNLDRINIVLSCHKSLNKFINKINEFDTDSLALKDKGYKIISYIDEAHLIDPKKDVNSEDGTYVSSFEDLLKYSTKVIALTATPNHYVTKLLQSVDGTNEFVHYKTPHQLIKDNIILPPCVTMVYANESSLSVNICRSIMEAARKANSAIHHKILVSCNSADQLNSLKNELEAVGYDVFLTCCEEGQKFGDIAYDNITEFTQAIEDHDGDCFVLHIKQMIAGIDVKGLTDCIISSPSDGCINLTTAIQTIGRTLRPQNNERGVDIESRTKKNGNVYIVTYNNDNSINKIAKDKMLGFVLSYYGIGEINYCELKHEALVKSTVSDFIKNQDTKAILKGNMNNIMSTLTVAIDDVVKSMMKKSFIMDYLSFDEKVESVLEAVEYNLYNIDPDSDSDMENDTASFLYHTLNDDMIGTIKEALKNHGIEE